MANSVAQRRELVEEYLQRVATGTAAEVMKLYGDAPRVEDPVGTEPRVGRAAVEDFYRGIEGLEQRTELREFRAAGDHAAAFAFDIVTQTGDSSMTVSVIEVMEFDDDGRIATMRAYWHPDSDINVG